MYKASSIMWRIIVSAIVASTLLSGCGRRTAAVVVHTSDTVRIATSTAERIVRDTISVTLPAQSAVHTVADTVSRLSIAYARSVARINPDGSLTHTLQSTDTPLQVPVDHRETVRTRTVYRDRSHEIPVAAQSRHTAWEHFRLAAFWPLMAMTVLLALILKSTSR